LIIRLTSFHPRGPGLSAGGLEGTSRDTCSCSRSFSWWFHRGLHLPLHGISCFSDFTPSWNKRERRVFLTSRKVVTGQCSKSRPFH